MSIFQELLPKKAEGRCSIGQQRLLVSAGQILRSLGFIAALQILSFFPLTYSLRESLPSSLLLFPWRHSCGIYYPFFNRDMHQSLWGPEN